MKEEDTSSEPDTMSAVAKSLEAIQAVLTAQSASHEETVTKQATVIDELTGQIDVLKGRIEEIAAQPAAPKVFTNGQTPPANQLRGQDAGAGATQVDVTKAQEMRTAFRTADPAEQNRIAKEMQEGAIAALSAIHAQR
jgi:hypothetical protein